MKLKKEKNAIIIKKKLNSVIICDSRIYRHIIDKNTKCYPEFLFKDIFIDAFYDRTFDFFNNSPVIECKFLFIDLGCCDVYPRFKDKNDIKNEKYTQNVSVNEVKNILEELIKKKKNIKAEYIIYISPLIPPKIHCTMKNIDYSHIVEKEYTSLFNTVKKLENEYDNFLYLNMNDYFNKLEEKIDYYVFDASCHIKYDNKIINEYAYNIFKQIKENDKLYKLIKHNLKYIE